MSDLLQGRLALITGAAGDIGSAIATRFAAEGASVILVDKDADKLRILYDSISDLGGDVTLVRADVQEHEAIEDLASSVKSKFGRLDILVSAVAVLGNLGPLQEYDIASWKTIVGVNFSSNWYLIKYFDSLLKISSAGRAIFVTSDAVGSITNYPYWGPYAASKAALDALVRVYAYETKHSKLCINMVYPGPVNSNVYASIYSPPETSKLPAPDELTDKFVELASEDCTVTGQSFELIISTGDLG